MAIIIDQVSEYKGERKVRDAIERFFSDDVVVYNNREVNGREYDLCILIKNVGVFIIEVKGWHADKIKVLGIDNIEVEGYDEPQKSPKKQAKSYCIQYINHKMKKKFNKSPLVVDLVAYPFITKSEYLNSRLDIVSEDKFTIFAEDLEDRNMLHTKFHEAFNSKRMVAHEDLTEEFWIKIRRLEEPAFNEETADTASRIYSELRIVPFHISNDYIKDIIGKYFRGTKQIIFSGEKETFKNILATFNMMCQKENIEPGNKLQIGFKNGISNIDSLTLYRSFNFEIYYVSDLASQFNTSIVIEDGNIIDQNDELEWLSNHTLFNKQQYMVEHAPAAHNTLVEAGAGTGKTFSMVSRVAFLCNKEKDNISNLEEELAMVTFTNDAARNMKTRLKQMFVNYYILTGNESYLKYVEDVDRAKISTIHKFSLELLRDASFYTGLGTNFRISSNEYERSQVYDSYLSVFLQRKEQENSDFINQIPVPVYDLKKKIIGIADHLLQKSVDLSQIQPSEMGVTVENTLPYFNEIIRDVIVPSELTYLESIKDNNAIDLKECIILLNMVLDHATESIQKSKLRYIFVDEFQDTDDVQIEVFQKIQKAIQLDCYLFVVGDLKQSIYRFRGAKLSAFDRLKEFKKYEWDTFHLNINYRTDYRLLEIYDALFSKMGANKYLPYGREDRLTSTVQIKNSDEPLMQCISSHGKDEEEFFETIFSVLDGQKKSINCLMMNAEHDGRKISQEERTIAILVRSNWQVDKIVDEAKKRSVEIEVKSGGDLFQLPATQDLYKLVLALENVNNPVYLMNLIESNYTDLHLDYQKIHGLTDEKKVTCLQEVLSKYFELRMNKTWLEVLNEIYTQPILFALKHIFDALQPWKQYSKFSTSQEHYIANYEYLLEKIIKFFRVDTLTLNQVKKYLEINILTKQKELAREIDSEDDGIHIICTTVHKSKGLEYGTVILPYTAEDIGDVRKVKLEADYSDSKLAYTVTFENKIRECNSNYNEEAETIQQIAEETRILYVALTRAMRNCIWVLNLDKKPTISWGRLLEDNNVD